MESRDTLPPAKESQVLQCPEKGNAGHNRDDPQPAAKAAGARRAGKAKGKRHQATIEVHYSLTPFGTTLLPLLQAITPWGNTTAT